MTAQVAHLASTESRQSPRTGVLTLPATTSPAVVPTSRTETFNDLIEQLAAAVTSDETSSSEPVDPAIGQFGPAVNIWLRDLSRHSESQRLPPPHQPAPSLQTLTEVAYQRGSFERGCEVPPRLLTLLRSQFLAAYESHAIHCGGPFGASEEDPSEQILRSMARLLCVPFTQRTNSPQYMTWLTRVYTSCRTAHRLYPAPLSAWHDDPYNQHWHSLDSSAGLPKPPPTSLSMEVTSITAQPEQC
jgi:hypothetical protein